MQHALDHPERGLGKRNIKVEASVLTALAKASAGDARRALGLLETACDFTTREADGEKPARKRPIRCQSAHRASAFDKQGDAYYDLLSAIHKSIRSSRRMPRCSIGRFIQGRRTRSTWYVGSAPSPRKTWATPTREPAGPLVMAAWDAYRRLGDYEGTASDAHAAIHLAVAPKSNRIDQAWNKAKQFVSQQPQVEGADLPA